MCSEKRATRFPADARARASGSPPGALLPHDVLKMYLHFTAEQLFRVWQSTVMGHLQADAIGYNAHYANGLAAIFIATGQDVANVVNAACASPASSCSRKGLYVSITLPALSVATVGGGTGLPTQREALEIMGCHGAGKAQEIRGDRGGGAAGRRDFHGRGDRVAASSSRPMNITGGTGRNECRAGHRRQPRHRPGDRGGVRRGGLRRRLHLCAATRRRPTRLVAQ